MVRSKEATTVLSVFIFISLCGYCFAANTNDTTALKKEITTLQSRVAELEQKQSAKEPAVAASHPPLMPLNDEDLDDPFAEMDAVQRRMNNLMAQQFSGSGIGGLSLLAFNPGYDIKGTDKTYVFTFDMPGMDKSKINIEIKNRILLISGERSTATEDNDHKSHFYRQQRSFGYFSRSIPLPRDAETDGIQAKYNNGVLTVIIDKKEAAQKKEDTSQKIDVK